MKTLALLVALAGFPIAAAADAPDHVVNDGGARLSLDCGDGGQVVVNGADNVIAVTGGCAKVVINGSKNQVAIAAADKITVTGSDNAVTWKAGWKKKAPKVVATGVGNKVAKSE